jgi:hypothetical protein
VAQGAATYWTVALPYLFSSLWPLAAVLAAAGLWSWPKGPRALLAWHVLGTSVLAGAAAAGGRYVVASGRFALFAAPALLLLVSAGLHALVRRVGGPLARPGAWTAGVAAAVSLVWCVQALAWRVRPYRNDPEQYFRYDVVHDVPAVLREAARLAGPDPVITSRYTGEQFRFYAKGRLPQALVCTRTNCLQEGPPMQAWLDGVRGRGLMILLEEEDRPWRREAVRSAGFEVREAASARGARLWEIRRIVEPAGHVARPAVGTE